jgi:hypothetical protein
MNYKDKSFEIDENQIKFKNNTFIIYLIIFIPLITLAFFNNLISFIGMVLTVVLAFGVFIPLYWCNTIEIAEISLVKATVWNINIDKEKNFWGSGKYKYHFPSGLNKKTNPNVIFIQRKDKKLAIGFVPENWDTVISVFKNRKIKLIDETY